MVKNKKYEHAVCSNFKTVPQLPFRFSFRVYEITFSEYI